MSTSPYLAVFRRELKRHGVTWCQDGDCSERHPSGHAHVRYYGSEEEMRVVHFRCDDWTVRDLFIGLHEIGHVILDHRHACKRSDPAWIPMWQREKDTTAWAFARLAALRIRIPAKLRREEEVYWRSFTSKVRRERAAQNRLAREEFFARLYRERDARALTAGALGEAAAQ